VVAIIAAAIANADFASAISAFPAAFRWFGPGMADLTADLYRFHGDDSRHLRYAKAHLWSQKSP
jgi:hypothetical protein